MERNEYFTYLRKYQDYEKNPNYLCHHGIKGQKWGIRRFQNEDGTLTEEGRRRYGKYYDENNKLTEEGRRQLHRKETTASYLATGFKVLKWLRIGGSVVGGVPYTAIACSSLGPMGLVAGGLVIGLNLGVAGVNNALSKACQRRADVYYEMLNKG